VGRFILASLGLPDKVRQFSKIHRNPPCLIATATALKAEQQLRQLRHVDRNPSRLVLREQLGR
jgi:hypothetical protein